MSIAYIVLAHKNPAQVRRLLTTLYDEGVSYIVAVSKKSSGCLKEFHKALYQLPSQIPCHWVSPKYDGEWGGVGIVQAALWGMQKALEISPAPDHIVQISGQCYPIKPTRYISEYFHALLNKSLMECYPLPISGWPGGGWLRIQKYHYRIPKWLPFEQHRREFPVDVSARSLKEHLLNFVLEKLFPLPRIFPSCVTPWGGQQWFGMAINLVKYILQFHANHPEVLKFHRHTLMPDEIYFSSIVGSSPEWLKTITQTRLHYCDWSKPVHPAILTMDYADTLRQVQGPLFARKFDTTIDARILDWIDDHLLGL